MLAFVFCCEWRGRVWEVLMGSVKKCKHLNTFMEEAYIRGMQHVYKDGKYLHSNSLEYGDIISIHLDQICAEVEDV